MTHNTKLRIILRKFLKLLLKEIIYFWTFIGNNSMKRLQLECSLQSEEILGKNLLWLMELKFEAKNSIYKMNRSNISDREVSPQSPPSWETVSHHWLTFVICLAISLPVLMALTSARAATRDLLTEEANFLGTSPKGLRLSMLSDTQER